MKNFMKKKFLIYGTSHKPLVGSKPLHIWFNKIDGFVRNYEKTWYSVYLALKNIMPFTTELDLLHVEKWLTLHIVLIIITSVLNKDQNHYYIHRKIFLKDNDKSIFW